MPNVQGRTCGRCSEGYWNLDSGTGCHSCECNEIGSKSFNCSAHTGQCKCKPGVGGLKCDSCLDEFYGFSTNGCKRMHFLIFCLIFVVAIIRNDSLFPKVVTHAQMRPIIVTRKLGNVSALHIVKESTVANVCQTHMDIRIKKDANFVIVIIVVQLDSPVICLRDNVYVVKDSQVADVNVAPLDSSNR